MNLNFTMTELAHSDTALKYKIDNTPNISVSDNLLKLIFYCLQPCRDWLKKPMIITSGYRCKALNSHPSIGGVSNSQHCTGQAADFVVPGMSVQAVVDSIKKSGIEFDQLINEYDKWVHISFNKGKNRKQVLKY